MLYALLILILTASSWGAELRAPAGDLVVKPRPGATTVLPGGRLLEPHGRQYATGSGPLGLAINATGEYIVTADSGPDSFSLTVLQRDGKGRVRARHISPPAEGTDEARETTWRNVFMGVAFAGANEVFVSEGDSGRVRRINIRRELDLVDVYDLNTGGFHDSYSGDLAYDPDRQLLYVVDQTNFRVVVLDVRQKRVAASVKVGRLPFNIALSPDRRKVYVTNAGMFVYEPIPDADVSQPRETGLAFAAFGFPSEEARNGAARKTAQGAVNVPGLGGPNVPESNSLCVINVENPAEPKVVGFVRTGQPVGEESHGGSSPSGVLAVGDRIYVANAHNDSISVVDANSLEAKAEIPIRIPGMEELRGVLPSGLAYHAASGWLFVAEAGINAVGVIDTKTNAVIGHVPAAWYPLAVQVHGDDVFAAAALGHGTGPNANKMIAIRERESRGHRGAVTAFPLPSAAELKKLTREVLELNGFVPRKRLSPPVYPDALRHVVVIVKESRTFDEVLGDVTRTAGDTVNGAPMLARFGRVGSADEAGGGFSARENLRPVNVTPNHHVMTSRWAFSDNFYSDADSSVAGRHWLMGVPPNPWTMASLLASYGGNREYRLPTSAPGRLNFPESNSSIHPEGVPERGTLFDHLERSGISFRSFGEGFELGGVVRNTGMEPTGARFLINVPMADSLYRNTSRDYPIYNMNIPDQYRATQFINEIEELYRKPGKELPRFLYIHLPNDDMALARPDDGYPFTASYVADNDYALGRIVEYLSKSPWWKNMVIFVTEDEGHGGLDHVDTHRVPFLALSPYARPNYVSHRNVSFPGLLKTTFQILGIPPLNLFDAAATDLSDCFHDKPGFAPHELQEIQDYLLVPSKLEAAKPR